MSSIFLAHKHPGTFQIVLQTSNASVNEAIELAVDEIKRIQQDLVSEEELETAKIYLIGSFLLCVLAALFVVIDQISFTVPDS